MVDFNKHLKPISITEIEEDPDAIIWDDPVELDIKKLEEVGSAEQDEVELVIPRCEFITGGAGTGKTFMLKQRIEEYAENNPTSSRSYAVLCATTGIAAINLGGDTTTVNSLLKFFDIDSLEENFRSGKLQAVLLEVSHLAMNIAIDEISMMHAKALDIIWDALVEINQHKDVIKRGGLGLIITGDFCQLPPVPEKDKRTDKPIPVKYAFEALCWSNFEAHTTKLTKVWRQDDQRLIEALRYARQGKEKEAVSLLREHKGVSWCHEVDINFDGTTIYSKNDEVDRHNTTRLRNLLHEGKKIYRVRSFRWGKQRAEWKNIPAVLELCRDSYVMILVNDTKAMGFRFANGSTGDIKEFWDGQEELDLKPEPQLDVAGEMEEREERDEDDYSLSDTDTSNNVVHSDGVCRTSQRLMPHREVPTFVVNEDDKGGGTLNTFQVKLKSNGLDVEIKKVCRQVLEKHHPDGRTEKPEYMTLKEFKELHDCSYYWDEEEHEGHITCENCGSDCDYAYSSAKQAKFIYETVYLEELTEENKKPCQIFFNYREGKWVIGEIYYYPLRLAYASTCHKSQGLTLDKVQIDFVNKFFGQPSMAYVALSRVRTAEGLRLVGSPKLLESRINVSTKVVKFI